MNAWLEGVRVLDLSRNLPGPAASWILGGMGARVDRVEPIGAGDPTRHVPPFLDDHGTSAFFASLAAGARSLALDLRRPEATAVLLRLIPRYEVMIDGFRPGVLESMGLGPDALHEVNPGLIIVRISGFGQDGPLRDRPGHDVNYLGYSSILAGAAPASRGLALPTVQVADLSAGLLAATGVGAALYHRSRTGHGDVVDVALVEAALAVCAPHVAMATTSGRAPVPEGELLTGMLPVYGTYRCSDGRWLTLGALEPKFLHELVSRLPGAPVGDHAGLAAEINRHPRDVWVERLAAACAGPVLEPAELAEHPHHAARGAVVRAGRTTFVQPPLGPRRPRGAVPRLGEHGDEILGEADVSVGEIAALRGSGVVG